MNPNKPLEYQIQQKLTDAQIEDLARLKITASLDILEASYPGVPRVELARKFLDDLARLERDESERYE